MSLLAFFCFLSSFSRPAASRSLSLCSIHLHPLKPILHPIPPPLPSLLQHSPGLASRLGWDLQIRSVQLGTPRGPMLHPATIRFFQLCIEQGRTRCRLGPGLARTGSQREGPDVPCGSQRRPAAACCNFQAQDWVLYGPPRLQSASNLGLLPVLPQASPRRA